MIITEQDVYSNYRKSRPNFLIMEVVFGTTYIQLAIIIPCHLQAYIPIEFCSMKQVFGAFLAAKKGNCDEIMFKWRREAPLQYIIKSYMVFIYLFFCIIRACKYNSKYPNNWKRKRDDKVKLI